MGKYYDQLNFLNRKIDVIKAEIGLIKYLKINPELDVDSEESSVDYDGKLKQLQDELKNYELKVSQLINAEDHKKSIDVFLDKIILGDCMDYLPQIPAESVHAFISDIPYGINLDEWDVLHKNTNSALLGHSPAQAGKSGFKRRGKPINGWNKEDRGINKEYEDWVYKWAQQVYPIMKEGAPLFIFGARRTIASAINAFEKAGFLIKDILSWEKGNAHHRSQDIFKVLIKRGKQYTISTSFLNKLKNNIELSSLFEQIQSLEGKHYPTWSKLINNLKEINEPLVKKYTYELLEWSLDDEEVSAQVTQWKGWKLGNLAPYYEPIAWFMKPYDSVVTLTDNVVKNEVGAMNMNISKIDNKDPKNILKFDFTKEEIKNKSHDAQKPVELIKYLINLTTLENQIVIDPFVGSGTTALACKETNRRFISFEMDESHHKVANSRINQMNEKVSSQLNMMELL